MELRKTLFISDLHLAENRPNLTDQFFTFLDQVDSSVDSLYILGDLFEAWLGDDDRSEFSHMVIEALKKATQRGLPIYFIHGNRDFLLGKRFFQANGCQLIPDITKINLYGEDVLLLHGDTLCTLDVAYQNARKFLRNRWLQKLFLAFPLSLRHKIVNGFRKRSKNYTSTAKKEIMDVSPTAVVQLMRQKRVMHMIHGHTHRRAIHEIDLNANRAYRFVLGTWEECANVLICDNTGTKTFQLFS